MLKIGKVACANCGIKHSLDEINRNMPLCKHCKHPFELKIPVLFYVDLVNTHRFLDCLHAAGINNAEAYEYGQELFETEGGDYEIGVD